MKKSALLAAVCVPAFLAAAPLAAKTLVYCSEGSPENFYPGVNTTGTSFDANEPDLQPHRRFRARRHQGRAGPRRKVGHLGATARSTRSTCARTPSGIPTRTSSRPATCNADDIVFMIERQWKEDNPYFKVTSSNHSYFSDMGMPKLLKSVEKVDDYTVKITLNQPEAPFLSDLAMECARRPVEGICRRHDEGRHAGEDRPGADRHRSVLPRAIPEGRRRSATRRSPTTGAARRRSTISSSRSRRTPRSAGPSSRRANAT